VFFECCLSCKINNILLCYCVLLINCCFTFYIYFYLLCKEKATLPKANDCQMYWWVSPVMYKVLNYQEHQSVDHQSIIRLPSFVIIRRGRMVITARKWARQPPQTYYSIRTLSLFLSLLWITLKFTIKYYIDATQQQPSSSSIYKHSELSHFGGNTNNITNRIFG
jgi:hypothetical protein